ncbi:lipopolysaccharide assembly protein LapA domain-containing protein [Hydrogenophaga sp.]|uniref:lipopolysaccharide assembly protein LapA domain-containing protein n=1 Tax=Hydrogenophaga sp. TaxID=1904254 RepID=UPI0027272841|nr:lipopolysaccharide assembly protein LapA domain-containing protein [Hydrogenophaga sp.]MDO9437760.1 lipopolysaccharide assembly protein LapA domain-containing protein [Hydrogenophaga sp.]
MKYLMWLLNAAIFFVLFAFALNNQDSVTLHLFFGASWQAPLVLVILVALVLGVFLGVAVMLPLWLRAHRARRQHNTSPSVLADNAFSDTSVMQPLSQIDRRHGL